MKKFITILILIGFSTLAVYSQRRYSQQNLKQVSSNDLTLYLTKAQKVRKTGVIMTIAGTSTAIAGVIFMDAGESTAYMGFDMFFLGLGATVIGIPILTTGSSRVKKISNAWNEKNRIVSFELSPCSIYNYQAQDIRPGIVLRMIF